MFAQRGQSSIRWSEIFSSSRSTEMCLSPIEHSCVAVDTKDEYKVQMNIVGKFVKLSLLKFTFITSSSL